MKESKSTKSAYPVFSQFIEKDPPLQSVRIFFQRCFSWESDIRFAFKTHYTEQSLLEILQLPTKANVGVHLNKRS